MCYAVVVAKFGQGEKPQTIQLETEEDYEAKLLALKNNENCVSVTIYRKSEKFLRRAVWFTEEGAQLA